MTIELDFLPARVQPYRQDVPQHGRTGDEPTSPVPEGDITF